MHEYKIAIYTLFRTASPVPRMAEYGDTLILHASRLRYKSTDGRNHQSNLNIVLNIERMSVSYTSTAFPRNHVSHSFDQYVLYDGKTPIFLDHGDAYPRSVVLHRANSGGRISTVSRAIMFKIPGTTGANQTGVTVGGFSMSDQNYLAAITTIDHSKVSSYTSFDLVGLGLDQRDIVVCVLPRNFNNGDTASRVTIGRYIGTDAIASTPSMLSNGDNTFTLVWREFSLKRTPGDFVVQVIDGIGRVVGSARRYSDVLVFYREFFNLNAPLASVGQLQNASTAAPAYVDDDEDVSIDLSETLLDLLVENTIDKDNERSYFETFTIPDRKRFVRVGDISLQLTKTDVQKRQYNIKVIVDGKAIEKKGLKINEPIQFFVGEDRILYEIFINWARRNSAGGYARIR